MRERNAQPKEETELVHNISFQGHPRYNSTKKADKLNLLEKRGIKPVRVLPPENCN